MTDREIGETVNFFVGSKRHDADNKHTWLVYRQSLNVCVDAAVDAQGAVMKAIRMAEFCVLGGQAASVQMRENDDAPWQTVWPRNRFGATAATR